MELVGLKVIHKALGEGTVVDYHEPYMIIRFKKKELKFSYPMAFDDFLSVKDPKIAEEILRDVEALKISAMVDILEESLNRDKEEDDSEIKFKGRGKTTETPDNIAFKCVLCNGGRTKDKVGYHGVCSDDMIRQNVLVEKHVWCSDEACPCRQYLEGEMDRKALDAHMKDGGYVCYESQILRDWRAFAGIRHSGDHKGQPMKLNQVRVNSLCILTTRDPDTAEKDRYIFAVFLIDEVNEGDHLEEGFVKAHKKYRIKLTPEEAHKMLFWTYHANLNKPERALWSSGLHRYMNEIESAQILRDLINIKKGTKDEKLAMEFMEHYSSIKDLDIRSIPENAGALMINRVDRS